MDFFSHSRDTSQGKIGSKLLINHLENVKTQFQKGLEYLNITLAEKNVIESIAFFHDLGKYTRYFQDYLLNKPNVNFYLKSHSRFGALYFLSRYFNDNSFLGIIGYWIIVQHHGNLKSLISLRSDFTEIEFDTEISSLIERQKSLSRFAIKINSELKINDIVEFQKNLEPNSVYFITIKRILRNSSIYNYFLINYLFSLLIEADKLDASDTPVYERRPLNPDKVDIDKGIPNQDWEVDVDDFSHLEQNQLRNLVRKRVLNNLKNKDILEQKLFTLTGPTGIGKTLTALDFALKLRKKISHSKNYEPQIIYALPFINIIEQSEMVYRDLFEGDDIRILTHYQYADALGQQKGNKEENGRNYNQKLMSLDTWQCDIVITTFVQFLQTLIGNRNKLLKKFNHYAGSIIILDEVQTISLKQLPLVGSALFYLSKFLDARIILMTATKPKVFGLANEIILEDENEQAKPMELLGKENDVAKVFKSFNRTKLCPLIDNKVNDIHDFLNNYFIQNWVSNLSCLIVVNTVQLSIDIFNLLKQYFDSNNIANPIYYLSTNIIPSDRIVLIKSIKKDIQNAKEGNGLKPILVSTQSVEAGVDLDFDMAFRDLGPIDSIIQVAGRVNRENDSKRVGIIFIIDFGKCITIYGPMTSGTAYNALLKYTETKKEIPETEYLDLITYYYNNIYKKNEDGFSYSTNIFKSMKELNYDGSEFSVSTYQVIESGFKTCSVFIENDKSAVKARSMFLNMVHNNCSKEDFEPYKKLFHQHIIALPDYLSKLDEIKQMNWNLSENLWYVPIEEVGKFYDSITGFIRTKQEQPIVCML